MFSKVVFFVAAMAAFVAATPIPGTSGQCNTGPVQCCNSVYQSQSAESALIASIVGLNLQGITGSIGTQCSPISAVGVGSNHSQQPVCCENNNYNGLIVVGCSPVNL
uniref:Hydrophobin n=1 Tax=Tricholoma vaccinum TaxID=56470 RepID=A0A024BKG7_9AGAR|nr:hydrophobin 2 [Tricholoma vaccinum]